MVKNLTKEAAGVMQRMELGNYVIDCDSSEFGDVYETCNAYDGLNNKYVEITKTIYGAFDPYTGEDLAGLYGTININIDDGEDVHDFINSIDGLNDYLDDLGDDVTISNECIEIIDTCSPDSTTTMLAEIIALVITNGELAA